MTTFGKGHAKKKHHSQVKKKPKQPSTLPSIASSQKPAPGVWQPPFAQKSSMFDFNPFGSNPDPEPQEETIIDIPQPEPKRDPRPSKSTMKKDFLKTFRGLADYHGAWKVWSDFIVMTACVISNSMDEHHKMEREKRYLAISTQYTHDELEEFSTMFALVAVALEENSEQDFLGDIYTELGLNNKALKQDFTPYPVAKVMSQIVLTDAPGKVEEKGTFSVMDPSCGTGSTLIALVNEAREQLDKAGYAFQNHVMVMGQDIDENVALACYVQLSILGAAGFCKVGDSLAAPMEEGDELDNYWFTPGYFFPVWQWRRIFRALDTLEELHALEDDTSKDKV